MTYDPVTCDKCANNTPEYGDDGQPIASGHRCAAHCTEIPASNRAEACSRDHYPAIPASCAEAHPKEGESDGDTPAHGGESHPDVRL